MSEEATVNNEEEEEKVAAAEALAASALKMAEEAKKAAEKLAAARASITTVAEPKPVAKETMPEAPEKSPAAEAGEKALESSEAEPSSSGANASATDHLVEAAELPVDESTVPSSAPTVEGVEPPKKEEELLGAEEETQESAPVGMVETQKGAQEEEPPVTSEPDLPVAPAVGSVKLSVAKEETPASVPVNSSETSEEAKVEVTPEAKETEAPSGPAVESVELTKEKLSVTKEVTPGPAPDEEVKMPGTVEVEVTHAAEVTASVPATALEPARFQEKEDFAVADESDLGSLPLATPETPKEAKVDTPAAAEVVEQTPASVVVVAEEPQVDAKEAAPGPAPVEAVEMPGNVEVKATPVAEEALSVPTPAEEEDVPLETAKTPKEAEADAAEKIAHRPAPGVDAEAPNEVDAEAADTTESSADATQLAETLLSPEPVVEAQIEAPKVEEAELPPSPVVDVVETPMPGAEPAAATKNLLAPTPDVDAVETPMEKEELDVMGSEDVQNPPLLFKEDDGPKVDDLVVESAPTDERAYTVAANLASVETVAMDEGVDKIEAVDKECGEVEKVVEAEKMEAKLHKPEGSETKADEAVADMSKSLAEADIEGADAEKKLTPEATLAAEIPTATDDFAASAKGEAPSEVVEVLNVEIDDPDLHSAPTDEIVTQEEVKAKVEEEMNEKEKSGLVEAKRTDMTPVSVGAVTEVVAEESEAAAVAASGKGVDDSKSIGDAIGSGEVKPEKDKYLVTEEVTKETEDVQADVTGGTPPPTPSPEKHDRVVRDFASEAAQQQAATDCGCIVL